MENMRNKTQKEYRRIQEKTQQYEAKDHKLQILEKGITFFFSQNLDEFLKKKMVKEIHLFSKFSNKKGGALSLPPLNPFLDFNFSIFGALRPPL